MNSETVHEDSLENKKEDVYKCSFCEKIYNFSAGMKGPISKLHQGKDNELKKGGNEVSKKEHDLLIAK